MAELLEAVVSWPSLVLVVVVFGFAPGFCLRLIVLAYPRSSPRRAELIAELYAVPASSGLCGLQSRLRSRCLRASDNAYRRPSAGSLGGVEHEHRLTNAVCG